MAMEMRGPLILERIAEHYPVRPLRLHQQDPSDVLCPCTYKLAALEAGLHFPRVVGVDPLRFMHCFTSAVLGHRRCLLRAADKSIRESFALGCSLSLQPHIHAGDYSITRGSEHDSGGKTSA
jgi:hypothetical protein